MGFARRLPALGLLAALSLAALSLAAGACAGTPSRSSTTSSSSSSHGAASSSSSSGAGTGGATSGPPSAAQLVKLTSTCNQASNGLYKAKNDSPSATVAICKLNGAFFWNADMDVDCDGKTTSACNGNTDPSYQNQTSATDSMGNPLDASSLPYVVIPLPDAKFDYMAEGILIGDVVAVVYNGKITYGVFGDEGPTELIGEASYAMAASLGIDPNPATGGADCCGVTYIVFPGSSGVVSPIEDHAAATSLGEKLATTLLQTN